ncbi:MAG: tyrosine-type recombinase/integrase [Lachnospiraceae bacterium]|nr:tyrosine-type recombinase/integrase [Lachnospiraceae bacterium]
MTVEAAFELFLDDRRVYCTDKTMKAYGGHVGLFISWLEKEYDAPGGIEFSSLPESDNIYRSYIVYLRQKGTVKNSTIRSYARHIKAFLRSCYEEDICRDYIKKVKLPKDDAELKLPLFADEAVRIDSFFDMSTEAGLRNYCIFHLMLDCGLRTQEVCRLQNAHMDNDRNLLRIVNSKENRSRIVLCPDFLLEALARYSSLAENAGSCPQLLRSLKNPQKPVTENAVRQLFADLKKQSGVERLHAHLLRHTFATSYLVGGGNLEFLRVFMGHCDYNVTKMYSSLAAQCRMLGVRIYELDPVFFKTGY